jgi:hypothetical protein
MAGGWALLQAKVPGERDRRGHGCLQGEVKVAAMSSSSSSSCFSCGPLRHPWRLPRRRHPAACAHGQTFDLKHRTGDPAARKVLLEGPDGKADFAGAKKSRCRLSPVYDEEEPALAGTPKPKTTGKGDPLLPQSLGLADTSPVPRKTGWGWTTSLSGKVRRIRARSRSA